jgi:hypothetical protein
MNEYRPPQLAAYMSGTFTAGIGFVSSVVNWRARGSTTAKAKKTRITIAMPRMRTIEVEIKEAGHLLRRPVSPADQLVEGDHRSKGEAGDAQEYDAKEYALHVLITATSRDGSDRTKIPAQFDGLDGG